MAAAPMPGPQASAMDAKTEAFPKLTAAQIERVRAGAKVRKAMKGEILFEPGDTGVPFFVLLSGTMSIVQPYLMGERLIATHEPGGFTGEFTMISGQRCLVRGRVTSEAELLEVTPEGLHSIVARDPELSNIFMRAFILRRRELVSAQAGDVILLGSRYSANTLRLREFLTRNQHPYEYLDLDKDEGAQLVLDRFDVRAGEIPVLICNLKTVLKNPSIAELADCLGLNSAINAEQIRDLIIVGAGPAGLAAAVYAASEGLDALMIETAMPGGQAGSSSMIENYLGFPTGLSGNELAARAIAQAEKFGAKMMVGHSVARLDCARRPYEVVLEDGNRLAARAVVIATGAQYNKPDLQNFEKLQCQGIYFGATFMEAQFCGGDDVIVVGGGNSAGQAAVYLSETAKKVYMLVRSGGLAQSMSRYLIQRIEENPKIELLFNTEIVGIEGDKHLDRVTWRDKKTGQTSVHEIRHLFVMAGASPRTDWLKGCVAMDDKGFILTGRDMDGAIGVRAVPWNHSRAPFMLETSLPGVFAVGDVRAGNVKRVASAVGEGSIAIHLVHRVLAEI
jgi:thioredoxin reductase (NADPH)